MIIQDKDILEKDIDEITFVILDLETTGLKAKFKDRIVEIGAVKLRNGKVIDKISTLINPLRPLAQSAYEINKIDHAMLKHAPIFKHFSYELLNFIRDSVVVAYNAPFDISFLEKEFDLVDMKIKFNLPRYSITSNYLLTKVQDNNVQFQFDFDRSKDSIYVVDVLSLVRNLIPRLPAYRQSFVADLLDINQKPTHRALEDVFTTIEIFNIILTLLKNFGFNKLKYLHEPNVYHLLLEVKLKRLNSAIEGKRKIKIQYLDVQSKGIKEYNILPEKIDHVKSILDAKEDCDLKHFFLDRILKIEVQ